MIIIKFFTFADNLLVLKHHPHLFEVIYHRLKYFRLGKAFGTPECLFLLYHIIHIQD